LSTSKFKVGDTVKRTGTSTNSTITGNLYKVLNVDHNGNIEILDSEGDISLFNPYNFEIATIPKTGWQQMSEAYNALHKDNRDYPAGAWTTDADAWTEPKCDFGCKYAFGNEHLAGCSLTGEINGKN